MKNGDRNKKRNFIWKLHGQSSHPTAQKLILLLKDASVDDNELVAMVSDVSNNWNKFWI